MGPPPIPYEVVNLMFEGAGMSAARARRGHLGLTQKDFTMSTRTIDDCIIEKGDRFIFQKKVSRIGTLEPLKIGVMGPLGSGAQEPAASTNTASAPHNQPRLIARSAGSPRSACGGGGCGR